jgi:hypothetical protein
MLAAVVCGKRWCVFACERKGKLGFGLSGAVKEKNRGCTHRRKNYLLIIVAAILSCCSKGQRRRFGILLEFGIFLIFLDCSF